MRGVLWRHGMQLTGVALVLVGIWQVYPPAAIITAGAALVAWVEGIARADDGDDDP